MYEERPKGRHLTNTERYAIERMHKQGYTQKAISQVLGVHQSTISRELKKGKVTQLNGDTWEYFETYSADFAQKKADYNKTSHGSDLKIGNNYAYLRALEKRIMSGCSPYAAIQKERMNYDITLSKTTVYRYIRDGLFDKLTYKHLPQGHRKKRKGKVLHASKKFPGHRSIERRKASIASRREFGHWEMDSIIGKQKGKNQSCLVLTERKHRSEIVIKAKEKTALETVKALKRLKKYFGDDYSSIFKTITCDNGIEFSDQKSMDDTGTTIFYCHPNAPSERGSNENANKLLRRIFPKFSSMAKKTQADAKYAQDFVNNYPRQIFGGLTSNQMLSLELPILNLKHPEKVRAFFGIE